MSTLIEELEQAAQDAEVSAEWLASPSAGQHGKGAAALRDRAARLRKRIEHVKAAKAELPKVATDALDAGKWLMFNALTGEP